MPVLRCPDRFADLDKAVEANLLKSRVSRGMTSERAFVVGLEPTDHLRGLVEDVYSAADRAKKADPGDRLDTARFESLAAELETIAAASAETRTEVPVESVEGIMLFGRDESRWAEETPENVRAAASAAIGEGLMPVLLVQPFEPGSQTQPVDPVAADPPAQRWESAEAVGRREAVEARFRAQIEEALNVIKDISTPRAIAPSGIQNSVVTEILREYVEVAEGAPKVDVPVEYRDGSKSVNPFPLRALRFSSEPGPVELDLHFALLSIRHTEMDTVVDGAWLRNVQISRPRQAAETDDFVYESSRTQLHELTSNGERRVRIHMYQSGLETAVVGFYRAVADHLLEFPKSVTVQPMYFQESSRSSNRKGTRQRRRPRQSGGSDQGKHRDPPRRPKLFEERALFREGTLWQM